jgi:transcriptional/translational regulatory protein YebC/TACO1
MVEGDAADSLMKLIDALEDNDDVQNVYANYEVSEETLQRLSA